MRFTQVLTSLIIGSITAQQSTLTYVTNTTDLSTLASLAAKFPEILTTLASAAPLTLFAPTNKAFATLESTSPDLFKAVTSNVTLLQSVLLYHAIAGEAFDPSTANATNFVKTASGAILRADVKGSSVSLVFGLGNSTVVKSNVVSNGVVHTIDSVLVPPIAASATAVAAGLTELVKALTKVDFVSAVDSLEGITILAPNDAAFTALVKFAGENKLELTDAILSAALNVHILKGVFYSTDLLALKEGSAPSAYNGTPVKFTASAANGVQVSGPGNTTPAKVVLADVLIAGGVVHVIDTVLLPGLAGVKAGMGKNGINIPSFSAADGVMPKTAGASRNAVLGLIAGVAAVVFYL